MPGADSMGGSSLSPGMPEVFSNWSTPETRRVSSVCEGQRFAAREEPPALCAAGLKWCSRNFFMFTPVEDLS